ncbi:embrane-bound lytic murein transglycosylase D [Candidatus Photodesmus blepharus]|uniref:Embrane-bound lytic murein transglycosylase D n=1 Tax=Candidatus Photodesmus blepharonis TaxID=1179155 RepID=A0A084CNH3_9GAMM|nr:embrane-bound lytic murein transglycosylase D [Candidatus Photodesmus blepharus]
MRIQYNLIITLCLTGCQLIQFFEQPLSIITDSSSITMPKKQNADLSEPKLDSEKISSTSTIAPHFQEDVWQRIAMQLKMDIPNHKIVEYYRNWYIDHPNHLKVVSKRAEPFLYLIINKIEQRNMPLEIALIPIVESSFDVLAYSSYSASGLWQFVPSTGKMYGLKQNFWYDGRRDISAATEAALDHLTYLNKRFDGQWTTAIAAYNSGGGRMSRAIQKNNKLGKSTDLLSLDLPKETSNYILKLLALADVIANQKKYGIDIPVIKNKAVVTLIDPKEQLDLATAANYAGISIKKLQNLNPGYNQWATGPDGPYQLLLPVDSIKNFQEKIKKKCRKNMKLIHYQVKPGDNLSMLAKKYSTTVEAIKKSNELLHNKIRIGQNLIIRTSSKDKSAYA